MLVYLSANIICPVKRRVFRERRSRKSVIFEDQTIVQGQISVIFSQSKSNSLNIFRNSRDFFKIGEYHLNISQLQLRHTQSHDPFKPIACEGKYYYILLWPNVPVEGDAFLSIPFLFFLGEDYLVIISSTFTEYIFVLIYGYNVKEITPSCSVFFFSSEKVDGIKIKSNISLFSFTLSFSLFLFFFLFNRFFHCLE